MFTRAPYLGSGRHCSLCSRNGESTPGGGTFPIHVSHAGNVSQSARQRISGLLLKDLNGGRSAFPVAHAIIAVPSKPSPIPGLPKINPNTFALKELFLRPYPSPYYVPNIDVMHPCVEIFVKLPYLLTHPFFNERRTVKNLAFQYYFRFFIIRRSVLSV